MDLLLLEQNVVTIYLAIEGDLQVKLF